MKLANWWPVPTNLIGNRSRPAPAKRDASRSRHNHHQDRIVVFRIGKLQARARLHDTLTANLIWSALPLHARAETWGEAIHFEVPLESGRDRTAKLNGTQGEIYYWADDDRVLFAFGPTPISRAGECRLPRPCNVWAEAIDDLAVFRGVTPGAKITLERVVDKA